MAVPPRISVIIPSYNSAKTLAGTVASVQAQDIAEIEIIIVDDCSTDDSLARVRKLASADARIRIIAQARNGGPAAARNTGLRAARGEFVCFLDADDAYASNFFRSALNFFYGDPMLAAVVSNVELVDVHRPVSDLHMKAVVHSGPCNLIVRRSVAEFVGGFSEHPAFRGKIGGEDIAFRAAIDQFFDTVLLPHKFFRHRMRPGGHLDFFLDRSRIVDGKLVFDEPTEEERSGQMQEARQRYHEAIALRANAAQILKPPAKRRWPIGAIGVDDLDRYASLRAAFAEVGGEDRALEGFLLYDCARKGASDGNCVQLGGRDASATCWLAQGLKDADRGNLIAVRPFDAANKAKRSGKAGGAAKDDGLTLKAYSAALERLSLAEYVEIRRGSPSDVVSGWHAPIRLLVIDGDYAGPTSEAEFWGWAKHLMPRGLVALRGVDREAGVKKRYRELIANPVWREVGNVGALRVMQRQY